MVELKANKEDSKLVTELTLLGSTTEIIKELSVGLAQSIMRMAGGDKDKALSIFATLSDATVVMMAMEYVRQAHGLGGDESGVGIKMPITHEMYEKLKERFKNE
jgi:hypothetical protein